MKFRKKPIIVEATQWFKVGDHKAVISAFPKYRDFIPVLIHGATGYLKNLHDDSGYFITPGDWIIEENGEFYRCSPDLFKDIFEEV